MTMDQVDDKDDSHPTGGDSNYSGDSSNPESQPLLSSASTSSESSKYIPSRPQSRSTTAKDVLYRTDTGLSLASVQSQIVPRPKFSPFLLLPLQFLSIFSLSMTATPRDQFMLHLICKEYTDEHGIPYHPQPAGEIDAICRTPTVQEAFSAFQQRFTLSVAVPALFGIALYGRLSDQPRFGRRFFAAADLFGVLVQVSMFLVVNYFEVKSDYLLIGSTICGALGGGSMYNAMFYAIASDVTTVEQRSSFFSFADAMLLAGSGLAPLAMSGIVLAFGNLIIVFWMVAVALITAIVYLFMLPYEQVFQISNSQLTLRDHLNVFKALTVLWKTTPKHEQYLAPRSALAYAWFVLQLNFTGLFLVLIPYTSLLFGWNAVTDGLVLFSASLVKFFVLMLAIPFLTRYLTSYHGKSKQPCTQEDLERVDGLANCAKLKGLYSGLKVDFTLTRWGLVWYTLCYVLFALAQEEWQFLAVLIIDSFGIVMLPSVRAAMTKMTPPKFYGQFLAAISLLNSLGNVVAPILFNGIYRATVSWLPAAALYTMSALFLSAFIAVILTSISRKMVRLQQVVE